MQISAKELFAVSDPQPVSQADPTEVISRELGRIHLESYGTGGDVITTHLVGSDVVLCMIDNELTPAERTLLGGGQGAAVKATRMAFQVAIEPTFVAVVERALGRKVEAFVSHFNIDPVFSVELFRLQAQ